MSATFGVPAFLAGVTVVAGATSLSDALVSARSAQRGSGETSLGSVFGSKAFDLLVAIPVGVLIAGIASVSSAVAAPVFGVLTLATALLFAALRTDLTLTGTESCALLSAYLVFVRWVVGETAGVFDLVVGA